MNVKWSIFRTIVSVTHPSLLHFQHSSLHNLHCVSLEAPYSRSLWCRSAVGRSPLIRILIAVNHKYSSCYSMLLFLSFFSELNLDIDILDKTVWATNSKDMILAVEWNTISLGEFCFLEDFESAFFPRYKRIHDWLWLSVCNLISSIYSRHFDVSGVLLIPPRRGFLPVIFQVKFILISY